MLLKKVEIYGFKTFADRTVFEIGHGITCVVGPNGCGKSNLVDALRWVLGEKSFKTLRCRGMTDVIFNGTPTRKPLGYAEVSLYFDNTGRHFPIDYEELCVTRRVYRTSESEYLINRQLCRMRDIKDLFANTGLGRSAYSIIGQGQIGDILRASPKERRVLFEEAAGISRYKQRRVQAARKLEKVGHDLDRVQTLTGELQKNLKRATVQAQRARRYKRLFEELRALKVDKALARLQSLRAGLDEVRARLHDAQEAFEAADSSAKRTRAAAETARKAKEEIERELVAHDSRARELDFERTRLRSTIDRSREGASEAGARAQGAHAKARESAQKVEEFERSRARAAESLEAKERELASLEEESARMEETRVEARKELDSLKALLEEKRKRQFEAASALARAESEASGIEKDLTLLSERKKRLDRELASLTEGLAEARRDVARSRLSHEEALASSAEKQREAAAVRGSVVAIKEEIARLDEEDRALRSEEAKLSSRLEVLRELERKGEGIPEAARELARAPGAAGILADLVYVCLGYEKAAEAALGELVTAVVVEEGEDEFLRRASASGATMLRAKPLGEPRESPPLVLDHEGIVARAIDLFWCDPRITGLFERLFGGVYIARGLHFAWRASVSEPEAVIVTTDGEIVVGWGKVRTRSEHKGGVISRRNAMAELEGELIRLREKIAALDEDRSRRGEEASRLDARLEALNASLFELKEKAAHARVQLASAAKEEEGLAEEKAIRAVELEQLSMEEADLRERLDGLRERAEEARLDEEEARTASKAFDEDVRQVGEEIARTDTTIQDMRVRKAALSGELNSGEKELSSLDGRIEEHRGLRRSYIEDAERESEKNRKAESAAAEAEESLSGVAADLERAASVKEELSRRRDLARAGIEEMQAESGQHGEEAEEARGKLQDLRLEEKEGSTNLTALVESGERELECRLDEELSSRGEVTPRDSLEEEIAGIERKLRNLGSVNHEALAEQEELSKKFEFLQTQSDDLSTARNSLRDLISQLNRKSRALFRETFERVKEEYERMFRKLFGGGRGELKLEAGEDLLEAGVEMVARPPGKNPKTLLELSGGERGLTAIALLFAIFRTRPSPFCVLDEADAPLDEENDLRFIRGIADFSKETQFIIITHKKVTMSRADDIYGMTMQEPGVTKKISVSFKKALSAA